MTCICGHQPRRRAKPHPERPRRIRQASALATARQRVGYRPLFGVALYQAITENA